MADHSNLPADQMTACPGINTFLAAQGCAYQITGACPHCSGPYSAVIHAGGGCPRVKAVEYHPNGAIKRVEFRDG